MSMYITDTHPLIYYCSGSTRQLSAQARAVFNQAENGEALILIPAPALWEVSMLEKAGHIQLDRPFVDWMQDLLRSPCFECVPLDADIIAESRSYSFNNDIFDAAIVATAKLRDLPLITKDAAIIDSRLVEIYW
ncbi:MAG: type II toxin-antitoxin system VapC family toxin [Acidobacteria bacterium]|nr:type II toxin-antitoxin system VapC family toxin [Acidobacteriota bacterium]